MKKPNKRAKSIYNRLTRSYGGLILLILIVFITFNIVIISWVKRDGIDNNILHSINNACSSIDEIFRSSVRQYLKLENEKIIAVAENYITLSDEGIISEEEAKTKIKEIILNSRSGKSEYSFAINNNGVIIVHPIPDFTGKDFSWDQDIQSHFLGRKGPENYVEYKWKNPEEEQHRDKILYMSTLAPLDWTVATTGNIGNEENTTGVNGVKSFLKNKNINGIDHIDVIDTDGAYIIQNTDNNPAQGSVFLSSYMERINATGTGKITVSLQGENSKRSRGIIFYHTIPSRNWVLLGLGYPAELYKPILISFLIMILAVIILIIVFVFINGKIARHLAAPLNELIRVLDSSSENNLSVRADINTGDEIEALGKHFNKFLDIQQNYIENINEAHEKIDVLAKFPDENPNPVIRICGSNRIEYANTMAQKLILKPLNLKIEDLIPKETLDKLKNRATLTGRNEIEIGNRTFSFSTSEIHKPEGTYLYGQDITRQKKFESLLLLSENIFKNSIEGILITDSDGTIKAINPAFTSITQYSEEDVIGKNPKVLKSHRHGSEFYSSMWRQLKSKGYWSGEIWNQKKNGKTYPEYLTITSIRNDEGEITEYVSFFHDLSDVKEKEDRIIYEATHDQLTGLPNREYLVSISEDLVQEAKANNHSFSVLYLDINNFKRINESMGAESGDLLLVEAAKRLIDFFKNDNTVIRAGSDEFICLIWGKSGEVEISDIIKGITDTFKPSFFIHEREINIEISIGISSFPVDDTSPLELVAKAEAAMRAAKFDFNSKYVFYSPLFKKEGLSRLEIEIGLKSAFENEQFFINYQPKVSAMTGKIEGAEALVRLNPIEGQIIGPDIFIPIAEEIGLIEPLGTWVLEKACRDIKMLIESLNKELHVAVNLSPWQFRNKGLANKIKNVIESVKFGPGNLNLEITESMAIDNVEESIRMMRKLTDIGLTLSIDDFGTGYSSLSYLSRFPVNILKIDKAFVDGIPGDPKKTGIVLSILSLADSLGMETVAEGVETAQQYQYLRKRGCSQIQGYYFYKPMLLEAFRESLLKEMSYADKG